jgi:hypothetical protein
LTKKTKTVIIRLISGCGGIGRRAGLRSLWDQTRGGSTPLIRSRLSKSCLFFSQLHPI